MKPIWKAFLAGMLMDTAIKSLLQDMQGKDAYLAMVKAGWVSGWYTVPIAITMLIASVILFLAANKETPK